MPNAALPQRIAADCSQKIPVRYGGTLQRYETRPDLDLSGLVYIPLVFAGWCRYLLCTRQACFGFLTPGEYVLTLAGEGCCLKLLVWLPPGANVALWWDPNIGEWGWRRERFHSFYNQA